MLGNLAIKEDVMDYYHEPEISVANDKNILLVEDSKSDVMLLRRMLKEVCYDEQMEIMDVPRLVDALDLLDYTNFDLVVLDLSLLDMDGVATVAALHAASPNTPIMVYSGNKDPRMREEALMCGAKHYLIKGRESPFALKLMINETMRSSQP